ncbi:RING-H2 finger protein ATL22-like [Camellia sinensis]|uniref:RING-H2 finger protein ATL22-like n=1 Tax=Camellia sinensis TaxID=4442 RepID=UPI0010363254|nr:RING-H2 finger protein ATL22-like [Camellia sinensis]
MAIFQGILLVIVLLLVPMAAATVVGLGGAEEQHDECIMPRRCRKHHGPEIRFPFRLKGKLPDYCGGYHPSFDLSCTPPSKYPMLQLPNFVNVFVKKINYESQTMTIYISDPHECFPRQLPNLNPSVSPFQFLSNHGFYSDYSFINCSQTLDRFQFGGSRIDCLSDQSHQVYATDSGSVPDLSCTKMYNMTLPYGFFGYASITFDDLQLNWSKPECGNCEAQGKYCRFKNNNSSGNNSKLLLNGTTECLDKPKQPSMGVLRKLEIAGELILPLFNLNCQ